MTLDLVIWAIPITRIRGCGWRLMGAFWGTLFQVAVAPLQWAMPKGHTIDKTVTYQMEAESAHINVEEVKAQRLNQAGGRQADLPRGLLNNLNAL
jgi:hypothetical protein